MRLLQAIGACFSGLSEILLFFYRSGCCVQFWHIVVFLLFWPSRLCRGFDQYWCRPRKKLCDFGGDRPRLLRADVQIRPVAVAAWHTAQSIFGCCMRLPSRFARPELCTQLVAHDLSRRALPNNTCMHEQTQAGALAVLLVLALVCTCRAASFVSRACCERKPSCRHISKHDGCPYPQAHPTETRCPHACVSVF